MSKNIIWYLSINDIYEYIIGYLSIGDIVRLSLCSQELHKIISEDKFMQECRNIGQNYNCAQQQHWLCCDMTCQVSKLAYLVANASNLTCCKHFFSIYAKNYELHNIVFDDHLWIIVRTLCMTGKIEHLLFLFNLFTNTAQNAQSSIKRFCNILFSDRNIELICVAKQIAVAKFFIDQYNLGLHSSKHSWLWCSELFKSNTFLKQFADHSIKHYAYAILRYILRFQKKEYPPKTYRKFLNNCVLQATKFGSIKSLQYLFPKTTRLLRHDKVVKLMRKMIHQANKIETIYFIFEKVIKLELEFEQIAQLFFLFIKELPNIKVSEDEQYDFVEGQKMTYFSSIVRMISPFFDGYFSQSMSSAFVHIFIRRDKFPLTAGEILMESFPEGIEVRPSFCYLISKSHNFILTEKLLKICKCDRCGIDYGNTLHCSDETINIQTILLILKTCADYECMTQ